MSNASVQKFKIGQIMLASNLTTENVSAGMVEVWLQRLVDGMQGTVKNIIKRASRNVQEMRLEDFIFSHPAQIALLGIQFQWTADTQVCFPISPLLLLHLINHQQCWSSMIHHIRWHLGQAVILEQFCVHVALSKG